MLQRVETIERYESEEKTLTGSLKKLTDNVVEASKEHESLVIKVQYLREQEVEVTTRLKTRQEEERLFEDSVKITHSLIERYKLRHQDFQNLMRLVITTGTSGVPTETLKRVRQLLDQYLTLTKLEAEIKVRSETLEKLDAEIGKAEERLAASTKAFTEESSRIEGVVKNIQATVSKVSDDTSATLKTLGVTIEKELEKTSEKSMEEIESVKEKAAASLQEAQEKANKNLTEVLNQCNEVLENIRRVNTETAVKNSTILKDSRDRLLEESRSVLNEIKKTNMETAEQHKKQMEEWGRIQAEAGKHADEIRKASVLLAFETDPEGLRLIGKEDVEHLILRLVHWDKNQPPTTRPRFEPYDILSPLTFPATFGDILGMSLKLLSGSAPPH